MFSIILPLYNKSAYIEKCILSVLDQTFRDFELIVVNDGSTDDGADRVKLITDDRIRMINQQNAGVSVARNNGVKQAKFDYIAFLDADDWWDEHFLEEMNMLIMNFPDAGMFGSSYYIVKHKQNNPATIGVKKDFLKGYIDYFEVYSRTLCMPVWTGAAIMKKSVFILEKGFNPQLKLGEDFDLWVRVALKYKVAFLNKTLSYYNQDVDITNRGVVADKLYKKEDHFIFHLNYLADEEKKNKNLKNLLDQLRTYLLLRYRLNSVYTKEVEEIISKVDFSAQKPAFRLYYSLPVWILKMYFLLRKFLSKYKNRIMS